MDKRLPKIKIFDADAMGRVAADHIPKFRDRVQKEGRDYKGNVFPKYSAKYSEYKSRGMVGRKGERLKAFKGLHTNSQTNPPNLTLRGLTMRNLRVRKYKNYEYVIGWDGEAAEIIDGLSKQRKKRDVVSGIPNDEFNWVIERMLKEGFDKPWRKVKNVKIRVGK